MKRGQFWISPEIKYGGHSRGIARKDQAQRLDKIIVGACDFNKGGRDVYIVRRNFYISRRGGGNKRMATSGISLSSSMRSNLMELQNTASLMDTQQSRLSTGKKANSAMDAPINYFSAIGLSQRAADLNSLKNSFGEAITIKSTDLRASALGLDTLSLGDPEAIDSSLETINSAMGILSSGDHTYRSYTVSRSKTIRIRK